MDKQKQIEEMEQTLCANCRKDGYSCSLYSSDDDWVCVQERERAEALYNAGCRKIPEGAVVLTKEEYEKLQALKDDYVKGYEAGVDEGWDNARKETVEKFAERLKEHPIAKIYSLHAACERIPKAIDEICKEITEGKV